MEFKLFSRPRKVESRPSYNKTGLELGPFAIQKPLFARTITKKAIQRGLFDVERGPFSINRKLPVKGTVYHTNHKGRKYRGGRDWRHWGGGCTAGEGRLQEWGGRGAGCFGGLNGVWPDTVPHTPGASRSPCITPKGSNLATTRQMSAASGRDF